MSLPTCPFCQTTATAEELKRAVRSRAVAHLCPTCSAPLPIVSKYLFPITGGLLGGVAALMALWVWSVLAGGTTAGSLQSVDVGIAVIVAMIVASVVGLNSHRIVVPGANGTTASLFQKEWTTFAERIRHPDTEIAIAARQKLRRFIQGGAVDRQHVDRATRWLTDLEAGVPTRG
jgi:hypothetical protein